MYLACVYLFNFFSLNDQCKIFSSENYNSAPLVLKMLFISSNFFRAIQITRPLNYYCRLKSGLLKETYEIFLKIFKLFIKITGGYILL